MKDMTKQIHNLLDQLAYKIVTSVRSTEKLELLLERVEEAKLQMWVLENLIKSEEESQEAK